MMLMERLPYKQRAYIFIRLKINACAKAFDYGAEGKRCFQLYTGGAIFL